jgi:hypothetical protein
MESNKELIAAYAAVLIIAALVAWAIYHGIYLGRGVLDN